MSVWLGNQRLDGGDSANGKPGYNIGDIFYTKRMDTALAGAVECNGGTYSTSDYTGTGSIGELLVGGKLDYISLSDYATAISTKGWCDKIGWDGGTTVRVPTLTPHIIQKNNIAVFGNGMTLGLTDGTTNGGLRATNISNLVANTGVYGQNVSSIATGANVDNISLGVTTDPTKSGIIADTSDTAQLRVMFQLFNSTTDQAVATVGTVVAQVSRNISQISDLRNMYNITETGKETIVNWCMPDYTAAVSMSSGAAAPTDGWAIAHGGNETLTYAVNGVSVAQGNWWPGQWSGNWNLQIMVSTGDIVTGGSWKFIPCKGVNQ